MNNSILVACPIGDPSSDRTWSGTPYHIGKGLEENNYSVHYFDATLGFFVQTISRLLYRFHCINAYYTWKRYWHSKSILAAAEKCNIDYILHIGSLGLTPRQTGSAAEMVVLDTTWATWSKDNNVNSIWVQNLIKNEKKSLKKCIKIFTISETLRQHIISDYCIDSDKICSVGTGVNHEMNDTNPDRSNYPPCMLFIGKERFLEKGGLLAIKSFELAKCQIPNLELIMVGAKNFFRNAAPIIPGLHILGFITKEELEDCYRRASVFLMPAIHEPWGIVYLEALGHGLPIIGLYRNALPEITDQETCAYLSLSEDPQNVSDTIIRAFSDSKLLYKKSKAARERATLFSWDSMKLKIISSINQYKT